MCVSVSGTLTTGPSKMLKRAPVWLKRPATSCFGFGGRLVSVINEKRTLAGGERVDGAHIEMKQVYIQCVSVINVIWILRPDRIQIRCEVLGVERVAREWSERAQGLGPIGCKASPAKMIMVFINFSTPMYNMVVRPPVH